MTYHYLGTQGLNQQSMAANMHYVSKQLDMLSLSAVTHKVSFYEVAKVN